MKYIFTLFLIGIALCAWCPWLEPNEAQSLINNKITKLESTVSDLCPIKIEDRIITKTLFGYKEKVSYDCSTLDSTFGLAKSTNNVFVTFYKDVIGMPIKTIKR